MTETEAITWRRPTTKLSGTKLIGTFCGTRQISMAMIWMAILTTFCANLGFASRQDASNSALISVPGAHLATTTAAEEPFDCRLAEHECQHHGICSPNGTHCDCSPSPQWFGQRCELRLCAERHNPCENGAICEKTNTSFHCHCPIGFTGVYCEKRLPSICDGPEQPCIHGICRIGVTLEDYRCDCHYGWTGQNCTETDWCRTNDCLNGQCVNGATGAHCECRPGWGGQHCELDVDECQAGGPGICQNGGQCFNLIGSFYCHCPAGFVGQYCERENSLDQCEPTPCQHGGQCRLAIAATTANWVKQFDWLWECDCPIGFEGPRCERIVDECALGRMTCVNGGRCVRPWLEEKFDLNGTELVGHKWHPAVCKCLAGFTGEFCEQDVNECEQYSGICQNGATCMNRNGTYTCLCVGGFQGQHCEENIDDCVDNLCYAGSTCVDGISRYNCLCAPDRVGNLCEFPNPCFNNPCSHGHCFADPENGDYMCQCESGWTGQNCTEDVDECAQPTINRCYNGKCLNTVGGYRCECEVGYTGEFCSTVINNCASNPCQNGATCMNDLGRYDCLCLPGYSGQHCEKRDYQQLNNCFLECQNGGICHDPSAQECDCPPPFAGILCEIEKPDPCEHHQCAHGSVCAQNIDYISYSCECPPYLAGKFCERQLAPCEEGYDPCVHGKCRKEPKPLNFTCECMPSWTGALCDRPEDELDPSDNGKAQPCPLASNPCQNGGQCVGSIGESSEKGTTFFECICPKGFTGPLCEQKSEERCGRGCRNGGKCVQLDNKSDGPWTCQCPTGFEGPQCESEKNACLNVTCKHKGKCVSLSGTDFRCDCAPGWAGINCEENVDECEQMNIICLNGGTCMDRVNNYRCECGRGFAGRHCEISVPVDQFNRTDVVDLENCRRQGCEQKAGDGKCDPECNLYACQFDGGDCSTKQANPFERCPQPSYCAHVFANGKCDEICNSERCLFDGFDCMPMAKCPRLAECSPLYANGQCDPQCNVEACGWDGGDCDRKAEDPGEQPQILPGELMLVLAVKPQELFPDLLRKFLLMLSSHLRASLSLSIDKRGEAKLFEWRSDSGIGQRIPIPPELNVTALYSVHYGDEDEDGVEQMTTVTVPNGRNENLDNGQEVGKPRSERDADKAKVAEGVAIFLRVDVTMCNLPDTQNGPFKFPGIDGTTITTSPQLLGVHTPCFSGVDSVAAYLGAANAKKALEDIGVPILRSEARLATPTTPSNIGFWWYLLGTVLVGMVLSVTTVFVVRRQQKPGKMRTAKTWRPPHVETNSKYGSSSTLASHQHQPHGSASTAACWHQKQHNHHHYPVMAAGSSASSNMPLMMSHAPSMASLYSQQSANLYGPSPMAQMAFYQQQQHQQLLYHQHHQQQQFQQSNAPTPIGGYAFQSSAGPPFGNAMENQAKQQQNHPQQQSANATAAGCSRSSSSGIGGSSTEHSPLGHHHQNQQQQTNTVMAKEMGEEERQRRHLLAELREQAVLMPEGVLNCAVKLEPWMVNTLNERGRTLLHLLFQNEYLMVPKGEAEPNEQLLLQNIDLLFKAGISVDARDNDGSTALSLAVRNRKFQTVRKLVKECEADANLVDLDGKTPLYHACANLPTETDVKIAEFLIKEVDGIQLDTLANDRETPLMRCAAICSEKSLRIAELLLSKFDPLQRVEFINQTGEPLRTALHMAAAVGNAPMVRLLAQNGINKEHADKEGKTALFIAVEHAQYRAVATLLELGADRNKTDMNDTKIMEVASQPGYEPIAGLFRQYPEQPQHSHSQFITARQFSVQTAAATASTSTNVQKAGVKRQRGGLKRSAPTPAIQMAGGEKPTVSTLPTISNECGSSSAKRAAISSHGNNNNEQQQCPPLVVKQIQQNVQPNIPAHSITSALPQQNASSSLAAQNIQQQQKQHSSHSLLTPPNSDQSTYSTTPSPNNHHHHAANALAVGATNPTLGMPMAARMPTMAYNTAAMKPVGNDAPFLHANNNQQFSYPSRLYPNWPMFGTAGLMGNNINPYAHQMPIAASAYHSQHQRFPSSGHYGQVAQTTTATPFYGNNPNFGNPIVQRQPADFLRNSMDSVFMSPQEESKQPGHFDYRAQLNFGAAFLNNALDGNGSALSNSLTQLDDISEQELVPKGTLEGTELEGALSNYALTSSTVSAQQMNRQNNFNLATPFTSSSSTPLFLMPEQSSPEN